MDWLLNLKYKRQALGTYKERIRIKYGSNSELKRSKKGTKKEQKRNKKGTGLAYDMLPSFLLVPFLFNTLGLECLKS
jgi:hypothetical protein